MGFCVALLRYCSGHWVRMDNRAHVQDNEEKLLLRFQYLYGPLKLPGTVGILVRDWPGEKESFPLGCPVDKCAEGPGWGHGRRGGGGVPCDCVCKGALCLVRSVVGPIDRWGMGWVGWLMWDGWGWGASIIEVHSFLMQLCLVKLPERVRKVESGRTAFWRAACGCFRSAACGFQTCGSRYWRGWRKAWSAGTCAWRFRSAACGYWSDSSTGRRQLAVRDGPGGDRGGVR
jgi:hypothetical protein